MAWLMKNTEMTSVSPKLRNSMIQYHMYGKPLGTFKNIVFFIE